MPKKSRSRTVKSGRVLRSNKNMADQNIEQVEGEAPTPETPTPQAPTPETPTPEAHTHETLTPQAPIPEAPTPIVNPQYVTVDMEGAQITMTVEQWIVFKREESLGKGGKV